MRWWSEPDPRVPIGGGRRRVNHSLVLVACMSTIRRLPLLNATSLMHFDDVVGTAIVRRELPTDRK